MELLEQLHKTNKVIPAISDTLFKRIMMENKEYLGIILEEVMPLKKEQVIEKGEFISEEIPSR